MGEHAGEMSFVVDRAAAVGARRAVLRRDLSGLLEQLLDGAWPRSSSSARVRWMVVSPTALSAMPTSVMTAVLDPHHRRRCRDRPVTGAPLDLFVSAAGSGPERQPHLGEHLALADGGHVRPDVEAVHPDHSLAVGISDHHFGLGRAADRGQILGGVGLAQRAADGAAVSHDRIGDHVLGIAKQGEALRQQLGVRAARRAG